MKKKFKIKAVIVALLICTFMIGIPASYARTVTPYATRSTGGLQLHVTAWFHSAYKTTAADSQYGVKSGKYIKQCWVKIQEGDYNKTDYSEALTKAENKSGSAELTKVNNPFYDATLTWGWKYQ